MRAKHIRREELYFVGDLSDTDRDLLRMCELMIRRRRLRQVILPSGGDWHWNAFIEALAWTKALIDLRITPRSSLSVEDSEKVWRQTSELLARQNAGRIAEGWLFDEVDRLLDNGTNMDEILFRLVCGAQRPVKRAGPDKARVSGLSVVGGKEAGRGDAR